MNLLDRYVAILLLVAFGAQGIWGGLVQIDDSETLGQQVQTALQLAFGLFGVVAGGILMLRGALPPAIEWGWTLTFALAGGTAAVAWGGTSIPVGAIGGLCAGLVALGIVWLGRRSRATSGEDGNAVKARRLRQPAPPEE